MPRHPQGQLSQAEREPSQAERASCHPDPEQREGEGPLELILLRHAEAFSDAAAGDHARALTAAGKAAAARVGQSLAGKGWTNFTAITSDARRAKETAAAVAAATGVTAWSENKHLYLAGIDAIAKVTEQLDGAVRRVVIVGHNPGWSEAVHVLSGRYVSLGTAAAACLKCDVADDWQTAVASIGAWDLVEVL